MPVNAAIANQLLHQIMIEEDRGGFLHINQAKRKRIVISESHLDEGEFVCWWALINQPTSCKTIQLKILADCIVKLGGLGPAIPVGPTVGLMAGTASDASSFAGLDRAVAGIEAELNGAWDAGVWSVAKDTPLEFSVGLKHFLKGGAAVFSKQGNVIKIKLRCYGDKNTMMCSMGHAERQGASYTKEICTGMEYQFEAPPGSLKKAA